VVVLQRRLERIPLSTSRATPWRLFYSVHVGAVIHETTRLIGLFLAAPNPKSDQTKSANNNATTDTDNNTNDSISSLDRHTRGLGVGRAQGRSLGDPGGGSLSHYGAIAIRPVDNLNFGRLRGRQSRDGVRRVATAVTTAAAAVVAVVVTVVVVVVVVAVVVVAAAAIVVMTIAAR